MRRRTRITLTTAATIAVIGTAAGITVAATTGDDEPLTGTTYDQAVEAALAEFDGKGAVTETELGDDGATYEVELRLSDGREVEVQLDEQFQVIGVEDDDDAGEDEDED